MESIVRVIDDNLKVVPDVLGRNLVVGTQPTESSDVEDTTIQPPSSTLVPSIKAVEVASGKQGEANLLGVVRDYMSVEVQNSHLDKPVLANRFRIEYLGRARTVVVVGVVPRQELILGGNGGPTHVFGHFPLCAFLLGSVYFFLCIYVPIDS